MPESQEYAAPGPAEATTPAPVRPRLWPAVLFVAVQWVAIYAASSLAPETSVHFMTLMLAPAATTLLLLLWWLFASRVPWSARLAGLALVVAVGVPTVFLMHESAHMAAMVYGPMLLTTTIVAAFVVTAALSWAPRWKLVSVLLVVLTLGWTVVRVDGLDGNFNPEYRLRWQPTAEEEFLAATADETALAAAEAATVSIPNTAEATDWPGFRGARRDGIVRGVRIANDWHQTPPKELWRRTIGPAWSSFAIVGDVAYTQEQRGEEERVVCLRLSDGQQVWSYAENSRFEEVVSGPGPRATPTFDRGRLFAQGARGALVCLDPKSGERIWRRDLVTDAGAKIPEWGFSSSPLVARDWVVVLAGADGAGTVAYDRETGEPRWKSGQRHLSYSSPHLARIGDVEQVLTLSDLGAEAFHLETGDALWKYDWKIEQATRIVQPLVIDSSVVIATGYGHGSRRVQVGRAGEEWTVTAGWESRRLKPYFNDLVLHDGHCYGFDARIFSCLRVSDGKNQWKGGRYGHGQVILFTDSALLVVISEDGELALLEATPKEHRELARIPVFEGKTWNHLAYGRGVLLVRNGAEIACFKLP